MNQSKNALAWLWWPSSSKAKNSISVSGPRLMYTARAGFDRGVTGEPLVHFEPIQSERVIGCCQCSIPSRQGQNTGEDEIQNYTGIGEQCQRENGADEMG
jgi:hypothetical protein